MNAGESQLRVSVLLSMQRALWDQVTPELRGVAVSWRENFIRARFLYDRRNTSDVQNFVWLTETHVIADFPDEMQTEFIAESVPPPLARAVTEGECWVYLRYEP